MIPWITLHVNFQLVITVGFCSLIPIVLADNYKITVPPAWVPPVPGLPENTDRTSSTRVQAAVSRVPSLLTSYLPAVMQVIAYTTDLMQYESAVTTTVEPPFSGNEIDYTTTTVRTTQPTTTRRPITTTYRPTTKWTTTPRPITTTPTRWTTTPRPTTTTTKRTTTPRPITTTTRWTTTPRPTTTTRRTTVTTTRRPSYNPNQETTPLHPPGLYAPIAKPPNFYSQTGYAKPTKKPTQTVTNRPGQYVPWKPTTTSGYDAYTTTKRPTTNPWWTQTTRIPTYMPSVITNRPVTYGNPTRPTSIWWPTTKNPNNFNTNPTTVRPTSIWWPNPTPTSSWWPPSTTKKKSSFALTANPATNEPTSDSYNEFNAGSPAIFAPNSDPIKQNNTFFNWFFQSKAQPFDDDYDIADNELLDPLPKNLHADISGEQQDPPAIEDIDNVNEFLRLYDDTFGRSYQTGNKRVPPSKGFVDLLMVYDLMKRDAKSQMLNKFEGYSGQFLRELAVTSRWSLARQMHTLMSRMISRGDTKRADIVKRCQDIMTELENPNSTLSRAILYIPALPFGIYYDN